LEDIAIEKSIEINEPFQGTMIGKFTVCAPTPGRYGRLILDSEKNPESETPSEESQSPALAGLATATNPLVQSVWGEENFSHAKTSSENQMSVVQIASICGKRILLTGDTGCSGLEEAAHYVESNYGMLPLTLFDVPHHGSR
jgi:beta-lactamase superfamily II metal-dependent hydrolase